MLPLKSWGREQLNVHADTRPFRFYERGLAGETNIILGLHGTIMTDAGFFIPRIPSTDTCSFLVAVAVSAITCTFGESKLLTSPMLFNVARKVSPLQQQKAVTVLTVNHYK